METVPALLALFEGNPPLIGGDFPTQKPSKQMTEQTAHIPVIWDSLWRYCDEYSLVAPIHR